MKLYLNLINVFPPYYWVNSIQMINHPKLNHLMLLFDIGTILKHFLYGLDQDLSYLSFKNNKMIYYMIFAL